MIEKAGMFLLRQLDPERAHGLALKALKTGLYPRSDGVTSTRLRTRLGRLALDNPVGLAAGFDKNAEALGPLQNTGFGFLEVGAATPRPQAGNEKPRLFRLPEDQAAINRFGFNNDGAEAIAARLQAAERRIPIGINLGANKDSDDRIADFAQVLRRCAPYIDFATVNVSSPNTERLRDLQGPEALRAILQQVEDVVQQSGSSIELFLKIAPDLEADELAAIAEVARQSNGLTGLIATNTTLRRDGLTSAFRQEKGGLSGQPLFERSTQVLAQLYQLTSGQVPLIGVGGVASAEQAYAKIRAGASAVQLYTGLVFGGLSLVGELTQGLDALLERDGYASIDAARGTKVEDWL